MTPRSTGEAGLKVWKCPKAGIPRRMEPNWWFCEGLAWTCHCCTTDLSLPTTCSPRGTGFRETGVPQLWLGANRIVVRTETATVVFTDLVGSTELANRLGHDAYEAIRRTHFATLRAAASQSQGTEIKSTGDGMVFSFGSAGDALTCMIRMQQ